MTQPLEFPRARVALLQEIGAHLLDSRKVKSDLGPFARELLAAFCDLCMRSGLDRVVDALGVTDAAELADHATFLPALVAQLEAIDLDGGGPRNIKPQRIAESVIAALGLTLVDEPDRSIALDDKVRSEVIAALAGVVDADLGVPQIRSAIIADARARCEERYHGAFDRLTAELDERGLRLLKQPKIPLDAVQAVQRTLVDARAALFDRVGRAAIDRAKDVLARANADAAARLDQPVTLRLTPKDVAILRISDARVPKVPSAIVTSLIDCLSDVASLVWQAPEQAVRSYGASQTFVVGDVIDHPKFGRGKVVSLMAARIDVEFADGKHTLVHKPK